MSLEDVKNAKKSEVTSQLVGMIGGGFPVDDNFGNVTSLEFPDQMSAEMFVNKIHDYICYSAIRSASLNKLIDAAETEEEVEAMNISLVSFADFVND